MNKRKLIYRLLASPFILGIIILAYSRGCIEAFIKYIRYGGEYLLYEKEDPKRMEHIYKLLNEEYKLKKTFQDKLKDKLKKGK